MLKVFSCFPEVSWVAVVEIWMIRSAGPGLCPMDTASARCLFNPFLPSSAVNKDRHFACEDCNGNVSGGFDAAVSQVGVLPSRFLSCSSPRVC